MEVFIYWSPQISRPLHYASIWTVAFAFVEHIKIVKKEPVFVPIQWYTIFTSNDITFLWAKTIYTGSAKTLLRFLNEFVERSEKEMTGTSLRIECSKRENEGLLNGFFTDTEIFGMLWKNDYDNTGLISPFFSKIIDLCCGRSKTALCNDVFTKYAQLFQTLRKKSWSLWLDGSSTFTTITAAWSF